MATDNDDYLMDQSGDEVIENGDIVIGDAQLDDCLVIFKLNKGALKSDPILGPNIITLINSANNNLISQLTLNLERDNKEVTELSIVDGKIDFKLG